MVSDGEACVLLTLPHASISASSGEFLGDLALEYVTLPPSALEDTSGAPDVLLVLRVGPLFETVLDPTHTVDCSILASGEHKYVLRGTGDSSSLVLRLPPAHDKGSADLETLNSILVEYGGPRGAGAPVVPQTDIKIPFGKPVEDKDLRGRFVLVHEDSNELLATLDHNVRVHEDPVLYESGREADPVVVELPEGTEDLAETEVLVRAIPPEDQGWMVKGAVFTSHVISGATTLLTSAMDAASNYYISHSTPSPHATPGTPKSGVNTPPPSRTLLLLQSQTTRKNLSRIHTASGHAVKLSNKTIGLIDDAIYRITGRNDKGKSRASPAPVPVRPRPSASSSSSTLQLPGDGKPPLPPRSRSRTPPPPSYEKSACQEHIPRDEKPTLPPRRPITPSSSSRASPAPSPPQATGAGESSSDKPKASSLKARAVLSALLVMDSIDASTKRLVDSGGRALSAAVAHKYGTAAGDNVRVASGVARNVVLVYVDVKGMGRRAIVKRVAKNVAKGMLRSK